MSFKGSMSILVLCVFLYYTSYLSYNFHFGHSESSTGNTLDKPYKPNPNETTGVGFDLTLSYGYDCLYLQYINEANEDT
jgi:hypothetical protein